MWLPTIHNPFDNFRKTALSEIGSKLCEATVDFLEKGFQRDDCYHVVIGKNLRKLPFKVVWEVRGYLLSVKDGKETLLEYSKQPFEEIDWRGLPSQDFQILHYYKAPHYPQVQKTQ